MMPNFLRKELSRLRHSPLAHNTGWMFAGQGFSLALQAGYFILLARLLGAREYGVFAGATALTGIVLPYSALGSGTLFMRYVSQDRGKVSVYLGNIVISASVIGAALTLLLRFVAPHLLSAASAAIIIPVAIGNCILSQLVLCVSQAFQTFDLMRASAMLSLLTNLLRMIAAAGALLALSQASAAQWADLSLLVSFIAAVVGLVVFVRRFGGPTFSIRLFASRAAEGFNFSLGGSAQSIYNDIDKTLLSHAGLNLQNGIYTLAYRVIDMATMPITALDVAALPRYFRQGSDDLASIPPLSLRLATRAALLGLLMSVCLFAAAPLLPYIAGAGFAGSVHALRWLCLIPAFRGAHQLTGTAVTGMGYQRYRTIVQFAAAFLNLGLNLWLIPAHGWLGAAWASLATDGSLAVTNLLLIRALGAHLNRNAASA
jgi:O-antigen/teichoic acid export membrane protein